MAGSGPPPFNKGRLALIWLGIAIFVVGAWLVVKSQQPAPVAVKVEPQGPEQPISFYLAQADATRGERFFARCAACHTIDRNGTHGLGPNLWGVMGAPIASRPGYNYSPALGEQRGPWNWEATARFLRSPRAFAPGTRMAFAGISNPQDRADVMVYMNRHGGSLPTPVTGPAGAR